MKFSERFIISGNDIIAVGSMITYYPNGNIYECIQYKNELRYGMYESHYINGNLEVRCFYKNGKLEGPYNSYLWSGPLWSLSFYKDGKLYKSMIYDK